MNTDASSSVLNSHICFNALATLQHIKNVENSCSFCSSSDHSTYVCPVLSKGEHVKDTSIENLSRSSVPHGLKVYEDEYGSHIISVQKFAKGCRFGPLMAPKSYIPIENSKFPLTIFGTVNLDIDAMHMPELKDLFKVRNIHLDTRNEKYCNWMIHVDPAQYLNEQNLIAYEEENEIFFAAVEDLDVGDILKVWYSPRYGELMKMEPLRESVHPVIKNVLRQGNVMLPDLQLFNNSTVYDRQPNQTEIMLPSIRTIIKPTSYICYEGRSSGTCYSPQTSNSTFLPSVEPTNVTQMTDTTFIGYDDDDPDQFSQYLSTSNGSVVSDAMSTYSNSILANGLEKEEKKIYPCQMCDKKYSTMTNIYRHVRTQHNYFLCSLCMNMFKLETELKEHIHKCPKSDEKKPQCIVCMQYFSNSWSLTRHIKIHVSAGECDPDIVVEKKIKEKRSKEDMKESLDFSDVDKNSQDSFANDFLSLTSEPVITPTATGFIPTMCELDVNLPPIAEKIMPEVQAAPVEMQETNVPLNGPTPNENDAEISACVVCDKKFKSKSCMNKHLRSVHTVKILSGIKRSSSQNSNLKNHSTSTKRSHLNDSQASITHTGSPVNPMTAKALASKLNERNSLLNGTKKPSTITKPSGTTNSAKHTSNEIPIPPLISIQPTQRFLEVDSGQQRSTHLSNTPMSSALNGGADLEADVNVPTFNIFKKPENDLTDTRNQLSHSAASPDEVKANKNGGGTEKLHKCDFCTKKFNKKYELKRHKAVHENISYTCPHCAKVVKRKASIIKHLRILHKDHHWSNSEYIAELKQNTEYSENFEQSESSNTVESVTDEKSPAESKPNKSGRVDALTNSNNFNFVTQNSTNTHGNELKKMKSIKPATIIVNYMNNVSLNDGSQQAFMMRPISNRSAEEYKKHFDSIKINEAIDISVNVPHTDEYSHEKIPHNNNYGSLSDGHTLNVVDDRGDNEIYKNVFFNSNAKTYSTGPNANVQFESTTPPMTPNSMIGLHQMKVAGNKQEKNGMDIPLGIDAGEQKPENSINMVNQANLNSIIDDCFFVDDALNCNVVLNSPFSSDNDVDGFTMTDTNDDCAMNKELLNKFHDRLEEMEEKIDSTDLKAIWNHMLDEDNLNDDIAVDDNDETIVDGVDETIAENNEFTNITAVK